jgi:hypothetical protein
MRQLVEDFMAASAACPRRAFASALRANIFLMLRKPSRNTDGVIAREDAGSGGADLLRSLESPIGDTLLKLLEPRAHAIHGPDALAALVGRPLFGVDNKTRTPGSLEATSWTMVFGGVDFSRATMPTGHSIHGPVALWM